MRPCMTHNLHRNNCQLTREHYGPATSVDSSSRRQHEIVHWYAATYLCRRRCDSSSRRRCSPRAPPTARTSRWRPLLGWLPGGSGRSAETCAESEHSARVSLSSSMTQPFTGKRNKTHNLTFLWKTRPSSRKCCRKRCWLSLMPSVE